MIKLEDLGRMKKRIHTTDLSKMPKREADIILPRNDPGYDEKLIKIWVPEQIVYFEHKSLKAEIHSFKVGNKSHRYGQDDVSIYYIIDGSSIKGGCGYPELREHIIKWLDKQVRVHKLKRILK